MEKRTRIAIGTPNANNYFHIKFMQSLMNLELPANIDVNYIMPTGHQLPFARNHIVEEALNWYADYLFFVDADMVFPTYTLKKLLSHQKDMVNALAFRRIKPYYPCIFNWNAELNCYETVQYTNGLLEVDATGMPAHLINMEVFKRMEKPWFYYRDNIFSSDITFCENAKKLGFKIMIDTDLKIGHISEELIVTEDFYKHTLSSDAKKEWNENIKKKICSLKSEPES